MAIELRINELLKDFKYYFEEDDPEKIKALNSDISAYYTRNKLTETENYARHLYNLSLFYASRGDYAPAYKPAKTALGIVQRLKNEYLIAVLSGHLGVICLKLGRTESGSLLIKKYYRMVFDEEGGKKFSDMDRADACINLGSCHYDMKNYNEAVRFHKKALEYRHDKDDEYANNLNLIGYDYERLGDFDRAKEYLKDAAALIEKLYTDEDVDYIANLSYLAAVYRSSGDLEAADSMYERVMYLMKKTALLEEPFGGELMNRAAEVSSSLGNDKKALELRLKALGIFEKGLGAKNIFYANCLREIAKIYRRNFIYGNAISNLQRDLEIKSSLMSVEESEYIKDARLLADVYTENGQFEKAAEILEYVIENIQPSHREYRSLLLEAVAKYMELHDLNKLYELHEKYRKTDPTVSFDEMLVLAEKRKRKIQ